MAYITMEDYAASHCEAIDESEFDRYAERASEAVDIAAGWKIKRAGLDSFGAFDVGQIKLACCLQAEFYWLNGIEGALTGDGAGGGQGYSIGKTQITAGTAATANSAAGKYSGGLCAAARAALFPTGLLYSGVIVES